MLVDEAQAGEVLDEFAVHAGLEVEVEVVDAALEREAGVAHPCCEAPVAVRGGLGGDEPGEELDVGPVLGAGLLGEGREAAGGRVEAQVAQVGLDLLVEAAHRWASLSGTLSG